jgi:4-amino-4-deoxy-L-arabinose transferase-like glycosyltransferase
VTIFRNFPLLFKRKPIKILFYFLGFILITLLVIWLNLSWRPDLQRIPPDSGFYAYFGKAILHGQIPYRDIWDNKPPLGYYLNALAQVIFGQNAWGVWWSSIVWMTGLCVLFFAVIRKLFEGATAAITTVLFLVALMNPQIFQGGNMTEVYALAPQIGIIGVTSLYFTKKHNSWLPFITGVLTASAFLVKQPTIMLGFSSLAILMLSTIGKKEIRLAFTIFVSFILGFFGTLVLASLYWIVTGTFSQFIQGVFFQGFSTVGSTYGTIIQNYFFALITKIPVLAIGSLYLIALISGGIFLVDRLFLLWLKPIRRFRLSFYDWILLAGVVLLPILAKQLWPDYSFRLFILIAIICLAVYILAKYYRLSTKPEIHEVFSPIEWVWLTSIISLPFELVMVSLGGSLSGHYFIIMLPAVLVAIAYPLWRSISTLKMNLPSLRAKLTKAVYGVLTISIFVWGISSFIQDIPSSENTGNLGGIFSGKNLYNELDQYVMQSTQPNDTVLVWHIHLGINFLADRAAPARVLFPLLLFIPPNDQNQKLKNYVNDIERQPPELILVQSPSSISLPFVNQPIEQSCAVYCAPEFESAMRVPQIRQQWLRFQDYFNNHYTLDTRIYDWVVYRLQQ